MGLSLLDDDGPVLCPTRALTGGYCPGCGMTRATGRAMGGDWGGAWRLHPAVFLLLAQLGLVVMAVARGGTWSDRLRRHLPSLLFANLGIFIALWAFRLTQGQIPAPW
ncbi:MAG: DUF2752 domain-containing protein [Actinomycetia bacterium]|nr:DUF2752 domain-containing protein [Actinomycetes bacterium]